MFSVKDAGKFSLRKDRPEGVATAPSLKPGPGYRIGTHPLQSPASTTSLVFLQFPLLLARLSQALSASLSSS